MKIEILGKMQEKYVNSYNIPRRYYTQGTKNNKEKNLLKKRGSFYQYSKIAPCSLSADLRLSILISATPTGFLQNREAATPDA